MWFVFWTMAYVIHPYSTLLPEVDYATRVTSWSVVTPSLVAAVLLGAWCVAGFRRQ